MALDAFLIPLFLFQLVRPPILTFLRASSFQENPTGAFIKGQVQSDRSQTSLTCLDEGVRDDDGLGDAPPQRHGGGDGPPRQQGPALRVGGRLGLGALRRRSLRRLRLRPGHRGQPRRAARGVGGYADTFLKPKNSEKC